MKSLYSIKLVMLTLIFAGFNWHLSGQTTSYTTVGTFTYTVPLGVTAVGIDMAGGQGGNSYNNYAGGKGGRIQCTLAVSSGMTLSIYVGGVGGNNISTSCCNLVNGGANGAGGAGSGGNSGYGGGAGGGSSDIRIGGSGLGNRVCVAAGGGGADWLCSDAGGAGGGTTGGNGTECSSYNTYASGAGATQTSGGAASTDGGAGAEPWAQEVTV